MFKLPEKLLEHIESMTSVQQEEIIECIAAEIQQIMTQQEQSESNKQDLHLITAQELLSQVRTRRSLETEQEQGHPVHRTWTIDPAFTEWLKSLPPGGKLSIRDK